MANIYMPHAHPPGPPYVKILISIVEKRIFMKIM